MWEKENGVEAGLPGHSYSPKQLFWIAAAQVILQVILNDINTLFLQFNQNVTTDCNWNYACMQNCYIHCKYL